MPGFPKADGSVEQLTSLAVGKAMTVPAAAKLYEAILVPLHSTWSGDMTTEEAWEATLKEYKKIMSE